MSNRFECRGLGMRYDESTVLRNLNLMLAADGLIAIVGPNGAGKSTLLGVLAGLRDGYDGNCLYGGREVRAWKRKEMAQKVAFVPQALRIDFPFTAEQVVLMGRAPHSGRMFESEADQRAAVEAMQVTDTLAFRARDFRSLSGGERQRVILASALAQQPQALLLDEPTTYLDLQHQIALFRILQAQAQNGILVATVTHDLNLAAAYSSRVIVLDRGEVAADGPPQDALNAQRIADVFRVTAELLRSPDGGHWIRYGA